MTTKPDCPPQSEVPWALIGKYTAFAVPALIWALISPLLAIGGVATLVVLFMLGNLSWELQAPWKRDWKQPPRITVKTTTKEERP